MEVCKFYNSAVRRSRKWYSNVDSNASLLLDHAASRTQRPPLASILPVPLQQIPANNIQHNNIPQVRKHVLRTRSIEDETIAPARQAPACQQNASRCSLALNTEDQRRQASSHVSSTDARIEDRVVRIGPWDAEEWTRWEILAVAACTYASS